MTVIVNGVSQNLAEKTTLRELIEEAIGARISPDGSRLDGKRLGIAAAINDTVVGRANWDSTAVSPGARIEIVTAVQGG